MRYFALWFALAIAPVPAVAQDRCAPSFDRKEMAIELTAPSPTASIAAAENFTVDIGNVNETACQVRLQVVALDGLNYHFPPYMLLRQGQKVFVQANEAASTASFPTTINVPGGGSTMSVPFQIALPPNWNVDAGNYSQRLQLSLVDSSSGELFDQMILKLNFTVPSAATLAVVGATSGAGGMKVIALGQLSQTHETRSPDFDLLVWSNAAYRVTFASDNRGQLVHSNGVDHVTYRMTINGTAIDLSGPSSFPFNRRTSSTGDFHRLAVIVPPVGQAPAGDYRDRITVTVTAN